MDALKNIDKSGAQCRCEDAIYYANGDITLLSGSPETGYTIENKTNISSLLATKPEGWTQLYFTHHCTESRLTGVAGETSWGGAGFVGLQESKTGKFLWILHLSNANNFTSVSIESDTVIAVSDYFYPKGAQFSIPVEHPETFSIVRR